MCPPTYPCTLACLLRSTSGERGVGGVPPLVRCVSFFFPAPNACANAFIDAFLPRFPLTNDANDAFFFTPAMDCTLDPSELSDAESHDGGERGVASSSSKLSLYAIVWGVDAAEERGVAGS